jgi:hypothetical protein
MVDMSEKFECNIRVLLLIFDSASYFIPSLIRYSFDV